MKNKFNFFQIFLEFLPKFSRTFSTGWCHEPVQKGPPATQAMWSSVFPSRNCCAYDVLASETCTTPDQTVLDSASSSDHPDD
jgi:hypothetical protein